MNLAFSVGYTEQIVNNQKSSAHFGSLYRTGAIKCKKVLYGYPGNRLSVQNKKPKSRFVLYKMRERYRTKRENFKKFCTKGQGQFSPGRTKCENEK